MQVAFESGTWPLLGESLDVRGVLARGEFAPTVSKATFAAGSKIKLPTAKTASGGGLLNGVYSSRRVIVDGWVRHAKMVGPSTLQAVLNSGGARITVRISRFKGIKPAELIAAKVEVRGVATPVKARG